MPARSLPLRAASGDPLTRWAERLSGGWPPPSKQERRLPRLVVGLEGCDSAFNALNAIRTCMHFGTAAPPCFLSLSSPRDIRNLSARDAAQGVEDVYATVGRVARFGEASFAHHSINNNKNNTNDNSQDNNNDRDESGETALCDLPIVAIENYASRAESIDACRVPSAARFVVGHENNGMSRARLDAAARVLYVPQYGTISSLNVVTSLGILLFVAAMDLHAPGARAYGPSTPEAKDTELSLGLGSVSDVDALREYQRYFRQGLPCAEGISPNHRVDARPVHPSFYGRSVADILAMHQKHRQLLMRVCGVDRFGLMVLCENASDQRSLAGIVRSANAFLVDAVCYYGRRKLNVIGTVGTQHYTPPQYIGPEAERAGELKGHWWLLDCAQSSLYASSLETDASSLEALAALRCDIKSTLRLDECDERLRREARGGVVLVVPPEGSLPPPHVLARCERLLAVGGGAEESPCGLPVAVAVGIALQRLSAALHPQLRLI